MFSAIPGKRCRSSSVPEHRLLVGLQQEDDDDLAAATSCDTQEETVAEPLCHDNHYDSTVLTPARSVFIGRMRSVSDHDATTPDDDKNNNNNNNDFSVNLQSNSSSGEERVLFLSQTDSAIKRLWPVRRNSGGRVQFRQSRHRPKRGRDDCNYWRQRRKQAWLIPAEHPLKITWDLLTLTWSLLKMYATHEAIRDRQFGNNIFFRFCEVWFAIDIILNFVTELKTGDGMHLKHPPAVWARYLTTWFVTDVLSLFPGETIYIQPIIDQQNRRGFFQKSFFRTRAVLRVSRWLRGRHFRLFGQVAKQSKQYGFCGAARLLRLIIKYVPKYLLFVRNMKAVVAIRILRQIHWVRKIWLNLQPAHKTGDDDDDHDDDDDVTVTTTADDNYDDDDGSTTDLLVDDDDDDEEEEWWQLLPQEEDSVVLDDSVLLQQWDVSFASQSEDYDDTFGPF